MSSLLSSQIAGGGFDALAARLAERAAALATAHVTDARLAAAGDPARWHSAGLLWPGFATDPAAPRALPRKSLPTKE